MSITEKIVFAITGMNKISIRYKNEADNKITEYKFLLPHLYGVHRKTENKTLSAYYMPNNNETEACWKSFLLQNIISVEIMKEKFYQTATGYNADDSRLTVLCNIPAVM